MSSDSITPFPNDDSTGLPVEYAGTSTLTPDLSRIRRGWSRQFQNMPTFPDLGSGNLSPKQDSPPSSGIPELPSLGAIASQVVLGMEGHDELFGEKKPREQIPDLISMPTPSTKTGPAKLAMELPQMPKIELPSPHRLVSDQENPIKELTAMPLMEEPDVSIPLARDQFLKPQDQEPVSKVDRPLPPKAKKTEAPEPTIETTTPAPEPEPVEEQTPAAASGKTQNAPKTPEYTDKDLQEALRPIIDTSVDQFLYTPTHGIHTYLEPMLRSTVRRAIAEQMNDASPFVNVSGWDKFTWKMRAILGSRTYEDIVFDHSKRYQVEEVYLLRPKTRSLISYASNDPTRHVKANRVQGTVKKIAAKTASKDQQDKKSIPWDNNRELILRKGKHCILAAVVHGTSNAILKADLDYALRQAESRFGKILEDESDIHLQILQPLLEGCLLIQSPAIPN